MDMRGKYKRTSQTNAKSSIARKRYFQEDKEAREKVSINTKKQWNNPKTRVRILKAVRKANQQKDLCEKRRKAAIKRWKDPKFREKVIPLMSGLHNHRYNPDRSLIIHRNGKVFSKSQVKRLLKSSCKWCGTKKNLQLDHIIAICAGGGCEDSNAQTLCVKCNNKKRDTIDMELMKSYRSRGISEQVMLKTIPNQADR